MSPQDAQRFAQLLLKGLPELSTLDHPMNDATVSDNVVQFQPPVEPETLTEFERRARQHFMEAIVRALDATWAETKTLKLGQATGAVLVGIMHRALDDVRLRFGFL